MHARILAAPFALAIAPYISGDKISGDEKAENLPNYHYGDAPDAILESITAVAGGVFEKSRYTIESGQIMFEAILKAHSSQFFLRSQFVESVIQPFSHLR